MLTVVVVAVMLLLNDSVCPALTVPSTAPAGVAIASVGDVKAPPDTTVTPN